MLVNTSRFTDVQKQIRYLPKPVIAAVSGYAVGGGHILHLVCDMSLAADNAVFGQTGPRVGSFDGGFGASLLSRNIGVKKAKEFWFLSRLYEADEALEMGLVNAVVPLDELERETVAWCREMTSLSPLSLRLLKASFNATEDGLAGIEGDDKKSSMQSQRTVDYSALERTCKSEKGVSRRA